MLIPLAPPSSFVAVAVGVAALEVIRVAMFHMVIKLAPVVAPNAPTPANKRSLVPSKKDVSGEQIPAGFPAPLMLISFDIAGVVFITPAPVKVIVYSAGFVPEAV